MNVYDSTKPYIREIIRLIQPTWETPFVSVQKPGCVIEKFHGTKYRHSDGIGTKGLFHWKARSFRNAVIDALAMNLNDLAVVNAYPTEVIDYLVFPRDDREAILETVTALVEECREREIAVSAGETAIHNIDGGLGISVTMLGFIMTSRQNRFLPGDVLLGLGSNGLHANGFTKVRELFGEAVKREFIEPTRIYFDAVSSLLRKAEVHGMVHITGGAFTKLKDVLHGADLLIDREHPLGPHPIFREIYHRGVSDEEMYRTFNCGIGFVMSVPCHEAGYCMDYLKDFFPVALIGNVIPGTGNICIESKFSHHLVVY